MSMRTCLAISLFAFAAIATEKPATEGAVPGQWTMDFDAAKKVASEKKLPLLINFTGSDWCGWCKHMDQEVFSQEAWRNFAATNLILVWIDFPKDKTLVPEKYVARNKSLSAVYEVEGYPAYILLDDDGATKLGQLGADREITPDKFIKEVTALFQNRSTVIEGLLKTLPEKTVKEYRAAEKQKAAASEELKRSKAAFAKKSKDLETVIEAQDKKIEDIRLEARLSRLPKDKAEAYRASKARLDTAKSDLNRWIATNPERNDENMKKFTAWREEIEKLENAMDELVQTP